MVILFFFFFNDTATTEIYTLSLHDALPISLDITFLNGEINVIVVGGKTEFTESVYSLKLFRSTVYMKKSSRVSR